MKLITASSNPSSSMKCAKRCPHRRARHHRHRSQGLGRQKGHTELYRGAEYVVDFLPKVKIEAAVDDALVERVIEPSSRRPHRQDRRRKIFVYDLEQVVRIRTGETGKEAL